MTFEHLYVLFLFGSGVYHGVPADSFVWISAILMCLTVMAGALNSLFGN